MEQIKEETMITISKSFYQALVKEIEIYRDKIKPLEKEIEKIKDFYKKSILEGTHIVITGDHEFRAIVEKEDFFEPKGKGKFKYALLTQENLNETL